MVSCRVCDWLFSNCRFSERLFSQEASVFFKKRAVLEEEYGRGMQKLAKTTSDVYAMNDGKAGYVFYLQIHACLFLTNYNILRTFVNAWQSTLKVHEVLAENRIRFAQRLNEMSEDLANLAKEVDKNRKQVSPQYLILGGCPYG